MAKWQPFSFPLQYFYMNRCVLDCLMEAKVNENKWRHILGDCRHEWGYALYWVLPSLEYLSLVFSYIYIGALD